jgi:hypothetical protein
MKKKKTELLKQIPIGMTERHREMVQEIMKESIDGIPVYQSFAEVVREAIVELYKNKTKK